MLSVNTVVLTYEIWTDPAVLLRVYSPLLEIIHGSRLIFILVFFHLNWWIYFNRLIFIWVLLTCLQFKSHLFFFLFLWISRTVSVSLFLFLSLSLCVSVFLVSVSLPLCMFLNASLLFSLYESVRLSPHLSPCLFLSPSIFLYKCVSFQWSNSAWLWRKMNFNSLNRLNINLFNVYSFRANVSISYLDQVTYTFHVF